MPDVVVYHVKKKWLVLIEAVTSHGPVDGKRRDELKRLFSRLQGRACVRHRLPGPRRNGQVPG